MPNWKLEVEMKVRFIGTGSIAGQSRSASTLIDEKILVDCGNGIVKTIPEQYIPKINVLLITHLHGDHFLDVIFLILLRHFEHMDNDLTIYGPVGTEKVVQQLFNLAYSGIDQAKVFSNAKVNFIELSNLQDKEVLPNYYVTSYFVDHGNVSAYGFTIKHDNSTISFSGDSGYCRGIESMVDVSDAVVLDANFMIGNEKHMGLDNIEQLAKKHPEVKIIPTHMRDEVRAALQKLQLNNLLVPDDGQEIEI